MRISSVNKNSVSRPDFCRVLTKICKTNFLLKFTQAMFSLLKNKALPLYFRLLSNRMRCYWDIHFLENICNLAFFWFESCNSSDSNFLPCSAWYFSNGLRAIIILKQAIAFGNSWKIHPRIPPTGIFLFFT